jgi:P-type conjugative transfer protein TrbJ
LPGLPTSSPIFPQREISHEPHRPSRVGSAVALIVGFTTPPSAAQVVVFDPNNYAQNVLTAARALQQINNQITSLQNQTQMLINQAKNLANLPFSSLQQLQSSIQRTQQLLTQAQRIAYDIQQIDRAFSTTYAPTSAGTTSQALISNAQARWQTSVAALQDALRVQAGVVANLDTNRNQMSALVTSSQSATGALQATQAGNQLSALLAQQLADLTATELVSNLVINTDRRTYLLELRSAEKTYMASVSWQYPEDQLIALRRSATAGRRKRRASTVRQDRRHAGAERQQARPEDRKTGWEFPPDTEAAIADVEARTEYLMKTLGSVAGMQNIDRILRLPGTINLPNAVKISKGRVPCPTSLIKFNGVTHAFESFPKPEIKSDATTPQKGAVVEADTTTEPNVFEEASLPDDLRALICDGVLDGHKVPIGKRSEQFLHAVGWLKDEGWSLAGVIALLVKYRTGIASKYATSGDD